MSDYFVEHLSRLAPQLGLAQNDIGVVPEMFEEFPQRQKAASFNRDEIKQKESPNKLQ